MIRTTVTYYDGQTSQPHSAELVLDDAGVVHLDGLAAAVSHPLSALEISPRLGNTVRSIEFPGGARAESSDHTALDALSKRAGRGRAFRLIHRLESGWRWAAGAALVLAVLMVAGVRWGVPSLAKRLAHALPDALAYDLGKSTLKVLDSTAFSASELPEQRRAELQQAFASMARSYPGLPLSLHFRSGLGPNAFALPDGTVVVTDELCKLATDDLQVMAVLAHEIGHVHHRHALRLALESSSIAILVSTYFGDVAQVTTLSAALPAAYAQAHYSREHETEADSFALEYLEQNAIDPRHFADILKALETSLGAASDSGTSYFASHPPTAERIQRFEKPGSPRR